MSTSLRVKSASFAASSRCMSFTFHGLDAAVLDGTHARVDCLADGLHVVVVFLECTESLGHYEGLELCLALLELLRAPHPFRVMRQSRQGVLWQERMIVSYSLMTCMARPMMSPSWPRLVVSFFSCAVRTASSSRFSCW
jgi:hypothetical protein